MIERRGICPECEFKEYAELRDKLMSLLKEYPGIAIDAMIDTIVIEFGFEEGVLKRVKERLESIKCKY